MTTKKKYDPSKQLLLEEKDYKLFGLILEEIRQYKYDEKDRIVEINYLDKTQQIKFTHRYLYNAKGQCYGKTSKRAGSDIVTRTFHLFDLRNRVVATYGEFESGHQYCHQFVYDSDGEQKVISMDTLSRDIDLLEIYKNDLDEAERKTRTRPSSNSFSIQNFWRCDICDGDQDTGCMYFDPTECPKFT